MTLELSYNNGVLMIWEGNIHHATYSNVSLGDHDWIDLPGEISEKIAQLLKKGQS